MIALSFRSTLARIRRQHDKRDCRGDGVKGETRFMASTSVKSRACWLNAGASTFVLASAMLAPAPAYAQEVTDPTEEVAPIIAKCLSPRPDRRFGDVTELHAAWVATP